MGLGSPQLGEAPGFWPVVLSAVPGFFRLRVSPIQALPSPGARGSGFGQELGVAPVCVLFRLAPWTPSLRCFVCSQHHPTVKITCPGWLGRWLHYLTIV